jgi:hypothetical protein
MGPVLAQLAAGQVKSALWTHAYSAVVSAIFSRSCEPYEASTPVSDADEWSSRHVRAELASRGMAWHGGSVHP